MPKIPHQLRRLVSFWLLLAAIAAVQVEAQVAAGSHPSAIVFMTDFGTVDDSVSLCKGVMYTIAPEARIFDLTHQVTPFSILEGARYLFGATPYYPEGTVFVGVIDPGVGSSRKAVILRSKRGQYFVLPDNGLITLVQDRDGIERAREITNPKWMIGAALSSTFHGRDIFSPAAAHLARGEDWTQAGPEVEVSRLVRLEIKAAKIDDSGLRGEVIGTDGPYGNLVTNITAEDFAKLGYSWGQTVPVRIGAHEINLPFVHTFSDVPTKAPLLYIDSRGRLAAAVNQGSFAGAYGIQPPAPLYIRGAGK